MKKQVAIINGPNLNLLGKREVAIYGNDSFEIYFEMLKEIFANMELHYYQSNSEGALIDELQRVGFSFDGIVFNPGGYTHTSVAIRDCIAAINTPVIEVHISNVHDREAFRHTSIVAAKCKGTILGLGLKGYDLALQWFA